METKEFLSRVLYWALVAFVVLVIIQVMRKIIGGSWATEAVIITLLVANIGYSFALKSSLAKIESKLSEHLGWHNGYKNGKRNGK